MVSDTTSHEPLNREQIALTVYKERIETSQWSDGGRIQIYSNSEFLEKITRKEKFSTP